MLFNEAQVAAYLRTRIPSFNGHHSGSHFRCPCPIHAGVRDSFAVEMSTGLYCCHSECGTDDGGDLIKLEMQISGAPFPVAQRAVCEIVGMPVPEPPSRGKLGKPGGKPPGKPGKGSIVAVYDYQDENGVSRHQNVRTIGKDGKKDFFQREKPGKNTLKDVKQYYPYRLRELLASGNEKYAHLGVLFVEGEKDADYLRSQGFVATCNSGGADNGSGKKFRPELRQWFRGRRVTVIADNDAPGFTHARYVADALGAVADARKLLLPLDSVKPGGGPDDFVELYGPDKLAELVSALHAGDPEPEGLPDGAVATSDAVDAVPVEDAAIIAAAKAAAGWEGWELGIDEDRNKQPKKIFANSTLVLREAAVFKDAFRFNELTARSEITRDVFDTKTEYGMLEGEIKAGELQDVHGDIICEYIQKRWHLDNGPDVTMRAIKRVANLRRYHPVVDYLLTVEQMAGAAVDGVSDIDRIESWMIDFLGVEDTPLHRAYSRCFLIQAVARALNPGCQADAMLILESPEQGNLKTSALRTLAGGFYGATIAKFSANGNANVELLRTMKICWFVDLGELASLGNQSIESTKSFMTQTADPYRNVYGINTNMVNRGCVFVATTNKSQYLYDVENRRFWGVPVAVTKPINLEGLNNARDRLFGAAVRLFRANVPWWLSKTEEALARESQADRMVENTLVARLEYWLQGRTETTTTEIAKGLLGVDLDAEPAKKRSIETTIGNAFHELPAWFKRKEKRPDVVRQYYWLLKPVSNLLPVSNPETGSDDE